MIFKEWKIKKMGSLDENFSGVKEMKSFDRVGDGVKEIEEGYFM